MSIQSVIFDKNYWKIASARKWLKEHDMVPIKPVHITTNFYRFRIREPTFDIYNTKKLPNHIELILGR